MTNDKDISAAERKAVIDGMTTALTQDCRVRGDKLDAEFVRQAQDPALTAAHMRA